MIFCKMTMKEFNISESDLEAVFASKKRPRKKKPIVKVLYWLGLFGAISGGVFLLINSSSLSKNLSYWYHTEYKNDIPAAQIIPQKYISETKIPEIDDNHLVIPAISVDAPISWKVNNVPADVQQNLQQGVIHLSGTALPGEKGNVFMTGHSSDLPWLKGDYKTVFALLNKLVSGDQIQLKYQNKVFMYSVYDSKVVEADDVSVLDQGGESKLSLMTCTPVGTSLRRLIVLAKQTYPLATANTESNRETIQPTKLPKPR